MNLPLILSLFAGLLTPDVDRGLAAQAVLDFPDEAEPDDAGPTLGYDLFELPDLYHSNGVTAEVDRQRDLDAEVAAAMSRPWDPEVRRGRNDSVVLAESERKGWVELSLPHESGANRAQRRRAVSEMPRPIRQAFRKASATVQRDANTASIRRLVRSTGMSGGFLSRVGPFTAGGGA